MKKFRIKVFADGANIKDILDLNKISFVKGFTTNPSLMKKSGIKNYKNFAKNILTQQVDKERLKKNKDKDKDKDKDKENINNENLEKYLKSSKPGSRSYGIKGQGW